MPRPLHNYTHERKSLIMAELFEIIMIVCFGFSWPVNVIKSYRARTTKGKSLAFLLLISIGYVFASPAS